MAIRTPKVTKGKDANKDCSFENRKKCPNCGSNSYRKSGFKQKNEVSVQRYRCKRCYKTFTIDKNLVDINPTEFNDKYYHESKKTIGKSTFLKEQKARIILSREDSIRKVNNIIYLVQSQTGYGWYKVQWNGKYWTCNCPDYVKNGHIEPCKHLLALKLKYESGFHEKGEYIKEIESKVYTQDWKLYNMAQTQEFELFNQFLYQLVSNIGEPRQYMGRPRHTLSDSIFCCIKKTYSQLSSRRSQYLFHEALQRHQISKKIHYSAISRTLLKREITPILHELVHRTARYLSSVETDFAIDSSGFHCSTFGNYCEDKYGLKRTRNWLKAHICIGVATNIITSVVITDKHAADSPQLKKLLQNTAKNFTIGEVSADMAYSSLKNLQFIDSLGGTPYIPFKRNATGRAAKSALWKKAFRYFQLHKEEFMEHYHKRSNVESTFAAIKKKFGESVKSKNRVAQENELLCKIISYNLTILINKMIETGVDPKFFSLLFSNGNNNMNQF